MTDETKTTMDVSKNPKKKSRLSGEEICALIESCGKNGVALLKLGDLVLKFQTQSEQERQAALWGMPASPASPPVTEISGSHPKTELPTDLPRLTKEEMKLREDQLAEMLIADPVAYEDLLRSGELE